jgi:hypothetical protein
MTAETTLQSDHPLLFAHECPHCHSNQTVEHTATLLNLKVQLCTKCGIKFKIAEDGTLDSWAFNTIINGNTYKLVFLTSCNGKPEFSIWHAKENALLGSEILTLKFLPDITPDNVQQKLPIYLIFL